MSPWFCVHVELEYLVPKLALETKRKRRVLHHLPAGGVGAACSPPAAALLTVVLLLLLNDWIAHPPGPAPSATEEGGAVSMLVHAFPLQLAHVFVFFSTW